MADNREIIRLIKYALLQTTVVPSIACDLLVFAYFIRHWRKEITDAPQQHVIGLLLVISFLQKTADIPMTLYLLRWGVVFRQTNAFCLYWGWIDYSLLTVSLHLVTWCSIERHLFIFHSQLMKKKWCLILFHYIPMTVCLIYVSIFYFCVIVFPTMCTNIWDYEYMFCGGGCYGYDPFWGTFDWLFHYATPILIVLFSNLLLFRRFIWQKLRHQQVIQWHAKRRMLFQLSSTSLLYLIFMSPEIILGVIEALWLPTFAIDIEVNYFYYLCYYTNQFLPFVIMSSLPGMRRELIQGIDRLRGCFGHRRGRQIRPTIMTTYRNTRTIGETRF